jgi:TIR domain-containing protein
MSQPLVFISHSSQDKPLAQELASTLRNQEIDVWIDHEQIGLGDSIPSKISEGLSRCDAILLLISSHYLQSRWCRAEYEPLLAKEIESGRVFVIAVRLDNSELPVLLHAKRYADFRSGITDTGIRELVESIGSGASYSGFERLVPTQSHGLSSAWLYPARCANTQRLRSAEQTFLMANHWLTCIGPSNFSLNGFKTCAMKSSKH